MLRFFLCLFLYLSVNSLCFSAEEENKKKEKKEAVQGFPCQFDRSIQRQLNKVHEAKTYIRKKVYPYWTKQYPSLFLYTKKCQFLLNTDSPYGGFELVQQTFSLEGFSHKEVYAKESTIIVPHGKLPYILKAQALPHKDETGNWLTLAMYDVWYHERKTSLPKFYHYAIRGFFQAYINQDAYLVAKRKTLKREAFQRAYENDSRFKHAIKKEIQILKRAILERNYTEKRLLIGKYLKLISDRYEENKKQASWQTTESFLRAYDGVAEYVRFRWFFEQRRDKNKKQSIRKTFIPILKDFEKNTSHLEFAGLLTVILVDQISSTWHGRIFKNSDFANDILLEFYHNLILLKGSSYRSPFADI